MKTLSTLFFLTFFTTFSFAQKQAVTENGEEVILYDNGTWIYKNQGTETTTITHKLASVLWPISGCIGGGHGAPGKRWGCMPPLLGPLVGALGGPLGTPSGPQAGP